MQDSLEKRLHSTLKTDLNTSELSFSGVPSALTFLESLAHARTFSFHPPRGLLTHQSTMCHGSWEERGPVLPPRGEGGTPGIAPRAGVSVGQGTDTKQRQGREQKRGSGESAELENDLLFGNSSVSSRA